MFRRGLAAATISITLGCDGTELMDTSGGSDASSESSTGPLSSDTESTPGESTVTGASEDDGDTQTDDTGTPPTDDDPDRPTYYVAIDGDDRNPGTAEAPWGTLSYAATAIAPGDLVLVGDGDYDEFVVIEASGQPDARLSFRAETLHGARVHGVLVLGSHVDIEALEVEANLEAPTGIYVDAATFVTVKDCYVHDCPMGGIDVSGSTLDALASDVTVVGNRIEHNGQWGIHVVGSRVRIEDNEVSRSVQHHPKGDPAWLTGQDADGLRIFGEHHTIVGNFIHDVADPADVEHNIDPHADCIQTWDRQHAGGRPVMTDTLIEGNRCIITHPSGKGIMMSALGETPCHDIVVRNNVFEFRDEGIEASQGLFANITVHNNVFKANLDDSPWGVSFHLAPNASGYEFRNNIMVDCDAQARKIDSPDGVISHNLVWLSNGAQPAGTPGAQPNELWGVDPMFVDYDGSVGGDYRLQPNSPAIDAGAALTGVTDDHDGASRPQGAGHDIGAYER